MSEYRIASAPALVTGVGKGNLGDAFVRTLLRWGCSKVYAGTRSMQSLAGLVEETATAEGVARVEPVPLELHDDRQVEDAVERCRDIGLLVNCAGVATYGAVDDVAAADDNWLVNCQGTTRVTRPFLSLFRDRGSGAIVNVMTVWALANPSGPLGAYAASKAWLHSATQAWRGEAPELVIAGVYAGPVDTPMLAGVDMPKADPLAVADRVAYGVERGETHIFPDDVAVRLSRLFDTGSLATLEWAVRQGRN